MKNINRKNLTKILNSYEDINLIYPEEFFEYLLKLQKSDETNMMLAFVSLQEEFNMDKKTAMLINKIYISHYNEIYFEIAD